MRVIWASSCRAVMPSGTRKNGSASMLVVIIASSWSCSLGCQSRWGVGVMFAVMAREKLSQASYCELESPMPARICGKILSSGHFHA